MGMGIDFRRKTKSTPVVFVTNVRKIEPMGSDCVRIYMSVVSDSTWEDRIILEMPINSVLSESKIAQDAAIDFMGLTTPKLIPTA